MTPQEVAKKILKIVTENPGMHNQDGWGEKTECGTSACVAGWAAIVTNNAEWRKMQGGFNLITTTEESFAELGERVLGLSFHDSRALFYSCNNSQAVQALDYLAAGKAIEWEEIL